MSGIIYRPAGTDDVTTLVALAECMWQEAPQYRGIAFSREHMAESLINRIVAAKGTVLVAVDQGRIVGFIAGHLAGYGFSLEEIASEDGWYVHPHYRKGLIGVRLLNAFYRWGKKSGAREVKIAPSAGIDDERIYQLLDRVGYQEAGRIFKRDCASLN